MAAVWLEQLSRGGLLLLGLTATFASVDWMMSLEPHWFSTIYGFLFMGGCVLGALAFATFTVVALQAPTALNDLVVAGLLAACAYFALGSSRAELALGAA